MTVEKTDPFGKGKRRGPLRRPSFWLVILGVFVAGAWVSSMVEIRGQLARLNTASRSPDWIAARLVLPEAATQARLAGDASPPRQGDPAGNVATLHGPPSAGGSATRRSSSVPETEREVDSSEIRQALESVLAADPELGAAIEALLNEADADERAVLIESLGDLYPVVVGSPRLPGSTGE